MANPRRTIDTSGETTAICINPVVRVHVAGEARENAARLHVVPNP
jgi:hypothetical protein